MICPLLGRSTPGPLLLLSSSFSRASFFSQPHSLAAKAFPQRQPEGEKSKQHGDQNSPRLPDAEDKDVSFFFPVVALGVESCHGFG